MSILTNFGEPQTKKQTFVMLRRHGQSRGPSGYLPAWTVWWRVAVNCQNAQVFAVFRSLQPNCYSDMPCYPMRHSYFLDVSNATYSIFLTCPQRIDIRFILTNWGAKNQNRYSHVLLSSGSALIALLSRQCIPVCPDLLSWCNMSTSVSAPCFIILLQSCIYSPTKYEKKLKNVFSKYIQIINTML